MRSVPENKDGEHVGDPVLCGGRRSIDLLMYSLSGDDASAFKVDQQRSDHARQ